MRPKFWAKVVNIIAYIKAKCLHKAMNETWHLNKHGAGRILQWIVDESNGKLIISRDVVFNEVVKKGS